MLTLIADTLKVEAAVITNTDATEEEAPVILLRNGDQVAHDVLTVGQKLLLSAG